MESLLKFIKCKKCLELLEKPVVLPCGNFICEKHQHEDREDNNSVYCSICDLHHDIPSGGFIRILTLEELIEQKIDCIDLGKEYRSAYKKLEDFSDLFEKFEKLKNYPDDKVYSIISELKCQIDLRREELKNKIDEDALSIIKQLDEYEAECKANIASINAEIDNNHKLNEWGNDLDRWRQQMRTFEKDIEKWKKIRQESSSKYNEMETAYNKFIYNLFLNRFNQYQNLKRCVGNDFDMIKNHSLTYVVKNVTQTMKNNKCIKLYSESIRSFGLDWYLGVGTSTSTDDESGDAIKYVGIYLLVEGNFTKETCDVCYDILILHRTDPSQNIKYNMEYAYIESRGFGAESVIKLNDLINNDGLYDAENDSFTVQIQIKTVEFNSIEEETA